MLTRSLDRAEKERAMRLRALDGLRKDLAKLGQRVRSGRVRRRELIYKRLGRLEERWSTAWPYLKEVELSDSDLVWSWDRKKLPNSPAAHHPTRNPATAYLAPLGLVITGTTTAQNLPRPKPVCVDDLRHL